MNKGKEATTDPKNDESFSHRLTRLRKYAGLTQAQLAERLGLTNTAVSAYERGARKPSFEALVGLSQELGVDPSYLLGHHDYVEQIAGSPNDPSAAHIQAMLTPEELDLIRKLRSTDPERKKAILTLLG